MKDVKEFLRGIRSEQTEIELLLLKVDNITLIHALVYDNDKIQGNYTSDLSETVIKNAALLNKIDRKVKELQDKQVKAYNLIYELENDSQRQIMLMYYLSRKKQDHTELTRPYSFEEVAEELHFAPGYVRHVHGAALNALRKKALA
jgi:hypothetical protein